MSTAAALTNRTVRSTGLPLLVLLGGHVASALILMAAATLGLAIAAHRSTSDRVEAGTVVPSPPPSIARRLGAHYAMNVLPLHASLVLEVPIDDVTLKEAVEAMAEFARLGRNTGATHQVATVNVDFLVQARRDPEVLRILSRTDLSVPDGMPVVWGSRLLGTPLRQRTSGADLVPALAARAAIDDLRLCFFGASGGVAQRAADVLVARYPDMTLSAVDAPTVAVDGTMDPAVADAVIERIAQHAPDILCVALGNPKQELWIDRYQARLGVPVCIGIGGTLDFLAGVTRRAPPWMRRLGLEWLHRAAHDPRRLALRYLTDFAVLVPGVASQLVRGRRRVRTPTAVTMIGTDDIDVERITVSAPSGRLDNRSAADLCTMLRCARRSGIRVELGAAPTPARVLAERLGGDLLTPVRKSQ